MKQLVILAAGALLLLSSCRNSQMERINQLDVELKAALTTEAMMAAASEQLELIDDELYYFPEMSDSLKMALLVQGAKCGRATHQGDFSIKFYETIIEDFPNHEFRPKAMFLAGFVAENDKNDLEKAAEFYDLLIEEYPDHELAGQAIVLKEQLGIPLEELIRTFEKNEEESEDDTEVDFGE